MGLCISSRERKASPMQERAYKNSPNYGPASTSFLAGQRENESPLSQVANRTNSSGSLRFQLSEIVCRLLNQRIDFRFGAPHLCEFSSYFPLRKVPAWILHYYFALNFLSHFSKTSNCSGSTDENSTPIPMFGCG